MSGARYTKEAGVMVFHARAPKSTVKLFKRPKPTPAMLRALTVRANNASGPPAGDTDPTTESRGRRETPDD